MGNRQKAIDNQMPKSPFVSEKLTEI